MWFAKLFGGRNEEHEDDEPARFSAPQLVQPIASATRPESQADKKPTETRTPPKKGFDPYNSGAFERRNAWERVIRR